MTFILIIIAVASTAGLIWWLHRNERHRRLHNAELLAPLPAADPNSLQFDDAWEPIRAGLAEPKQNTMPLSTDSEPEVNPLEPENQAAIENLVLSLTPTPSALHPFPASTTPPSGGNWQDQLRAFRDAGALGAALTLARAHFPRSHALQQAAVILRQQLRQGIDRKQPVNHLVRELYDVALTAALPRNKAAPTLDAFGPNSEERYRLIGYEHLKLLTKNDVRYLRQLWGEPERHLSPERTPHQ